MNCGGTERVLTTRLNYLASHTSYSLYIVTTESQLGTPFFKLDPRISVISLDINFNESESFLSKLSSYNSKLRLYKTKLLSILKDIKPDIVTSFLSHEIEFLSALDDGSVKIGENHFNRNFRYSFVKNNTRNPLRRAIAKYRNFTLGNNVKKLDVLVTLTQADADSWPVGVKKYVIPNPLSFEKVQKSVGGTNRIISAGRLAKEKGFDLLLKAWRMASESFPDWSLAIYGEGDERDNLLSLIDGQGLKGVRIYPFEPNISDEFVNSDIYVLSSRFEGFGLVMIEAMECGLPIVAFDCEFGPCEIISDGEDGLLVKNGDVEALSDAMRRLMSDSDLRATMRMSAIAKARKYQLDNVMKKWEKLYTTIVR